MAQPGGTYFYKFSVKCEYSSCGNSAEVANSGEITSSSWAVPSGALYWGAVYNWSISMSTPWAFGGTFPLFVFRPSHRFGTAVPLPGGQQVGLSAQSPDVAGVKLSDRHFEYGSTDAALVTPGDPLNISRRYASTNATTGAFGLGWSSLVDVKITPSATGYVVHTSDGQDIGFGRNPNGSYAPAAGSGGSSLAPCASPCSGGDIVFTDQTARQYIFNGNRLVKTVDDMGLAKTFAYDSNGKLVTIKDVPSSRTLNLVWTDGKVASVTSGTAPASAPATWTYTYTGTLLTSVCPPESTTACTKYGYTSNLLSTVTRANGTIANAVTYLTGKVTNSTVDGLATTFSTASDPDGQKVLSTQTGGVTTFRLDRWGRPIERTTTAGNLDRWAYNNNGELVTYLNGVGAKVQLTYANGKLASRTVSGTGIYQWTNYGYVTSGPAIGKLASVYAGAVDPAKEILAIGYDSAGRPNSISEGTPGADRATRSIEYSTGTELSCTSTTSKIPAGLPLVFTDASGNKTTRSYTTRGDLCREQDPAGGANAYTYDTWGRVLTVSQLLTSDTPSTMLTYAYGANGLVSTETAAATTDLVSGKSRQQRLAYTYDVNYNRTSVTEADVKSTTTRTSAYQYDAYDRLTLETHADGSTVAYAYDSRGNIISKTGENGVTLAYSYDPYGRLTATTVPYSDPTGNTPSHSIDLEKREYDAADRVVKTTDRAGHSTAFAYDALDAITKVTSLAQPLAGGTTKDVVTESYSYDTRGNVTSLRLNDAATTISATYDSRSQLKSATTTIPAVGDAPAATRVANFTYDPRGLMTQQKLGSVDQASQTTTTAYDAAGRVSAVTTSTTPDSADKATTWYQRNLRGDIVGVTDPRGSAAGDPAWTTQYQLNKLGDILQVNAPPAQAGATQPSTQFSYDALGRLSLVIGPDGQRVARTYDAMDRVLTETSPYFTPAPSGGAPKTKTTYNPDGSVSSITAPGGQQTSTTYDTLGQPVEITVSPRITGGANRVSTISYDDAGNAIVLTDPSGATLERTFDALGRNTSSSRTVNLGDETSTATSRQAFDIAGNVVSSTDFAGGTSLASYNALGELASATDPDGGITKYSYDYLGQVTQAIDPVGNKQVIQRDPRGNTTAISEYDTTDALIGTTAYTYDLAGNQLSAKDPRGNTDTFIYDALNRLTSATSADAATMSLGYDLTGNVTSYTDQRGNTTTATYTADGQLASLVEPETTAYPAVADRTTSWTYTKDARPATTTNPGGGKITNSYDLDGNVIKETATKSGTTTATTTFGYSDLDDLTSFSVPGGTQNLTYNEAGWPLTSTGPAGSASYTYDSMGHPDSVTDATGTATSTWTPGGRLATFQPPGGPAVSYAYDAAGKTTTETWGSTLVRALTYVDGDLLGSDTTTRSDGTVLSSAAYTYDDAGNLTKRITSPSSVAGAGQTTYAYDKRDRLIAWRAPDNIKRTITWDAADNVTSIDGVGRTYDQRNRLLTVGSDTATYDAQGNLTATAGTNARAYAWDAFGNLTSDGTTSYTYDSLGRVSKAGADTFTYHGTDPDPSKIGTTSLSRNPNGELVQSGSSYVLTDIRGDVTGTIADDGTLSSRTYNPQGQVTASAGTGTSPAGMQNDYTAPGGLVDMHARWYSPDLGVFTSRDNISLPLDQQNRYAFGGGHWPSTNDPTGHCPACAVLPVAIGGYEIVTWGTAAVLSIGLGAVAFDQASRNQDAFFTGLGNIFGSNSSSTSSSSTNTWNMSLDFGSSSSMSFGAGVSVPALNISIPAINLGSLNASMASLSASMSSLSSSMASLTASMNALSVSMAGFESSMAAFNASMTAFSASMASWASVAPYTGEHPNSYIVENVVPNVGAGTGASKVQCATGGNADACSAAVGATPVCAVPGGSPATACAPALPAMWTNASAGAGDGAGAYSGGYSTPHSGCAPDEAPTPTGCHKLQLLLQGIVSESRETLANNPQLRNDQLYPLEREAEMYVPWLRYANNGKAMERYVASRPDVQRIFEYIGPRGGLDFRSVFSGFEVELTTDNPFTIAAHLARNGVTRDNLVTYTNWWFGG